MKMTQRDRRALVLLGIAVVLVLMFRAATADTASSTKVVVPVQSVDAAELRLRRARQSLARVPGKEEVLKQAAAELAAREKGLIVADTVNQAQAQVLEVVRKLAKNAGVDVRGTEFSQPRSFGDAYGEVAVSVSGECQIEQLVNLLADLANQPQLLATSDLRIAAANPKQKTVTVRMTVSGIVPKRLVPEKKV